MNCIYGPDRKLEKLLKRSDKGINPLDIATIHTYINKRHQADKELTAKTWARVLSKYI